MQVNAACAETFSFVCFYAPSSHEHYIPHAVFFFFYLCFCSCTVWFYTHEYIRTLSAADYVHVSHRLLPVFQKVQLDVLWSMLCWMMRVSTRNRQTDRGNCLFTTWFFNNSFIQQTLLCYCTWFSSVWHFQCLCTVCCFHLLCQLPAPVWHQTSSTCDIHFLKKKKKAFICMHCTASTDASTLDWTQIICVGTTFIFTFFFLSTEVLQEIQKSLEGDQT